MLVWERWSKMKIYFVENELAERSYFESQLPAHELRFVEGLDEVSADADAVSTFIYSKIDAAFLDAHPHLALVATRSTTHDHLDLAECARRGVTVCGVPSYGDHTVAEHTFALLLAVARKLREAFESNKHAAFSFEALRGFELRGKTFGIIGTGRIGQHAARLAKGFGMEVLAFELAPRLDSAKAIGFQYVTLDELLARSHIISLHAALTPASYHMLNRETLAKCRRGVVLINTARGALVDTDALIAALDSGQVAAAGLDVLEEERVMRSAASNIISQQIVQRLQTLFVPEEARMQDAQRVNELLALMHNDDLISRRNVVFTPHIAFNSIEAVERINETTVKNIRAFASGAPVNVLAPSPNEAGFKRVKTTLSNRQLMKLPERQIQTVEAIP